MHGESKLVLIRPSRFVPSRSAPTLLAPAHPVPSPPIPSHIAHIPTVQTKLTQPLPLSSQSEIESCIERIKNQKGVPRGECPPCPPPPPLREHKTNISSPRSD